MRYNKIKIEAHSQSINKVVTRFEDEFNVNAQGEKPTDKLESLIHLLKIKNSNNAEDIDALVIQAFSIGVQSGFDRALDRFKDGKITSRKMPNEDQWRLSSYSQRYQITVDLPSAKNEEIKTTVYLYLSDSGFE
ncbi:hypothetical protein [Pseudescherichia sp.]|uniref:hypothetical protein n=1 Tax=Pseudescherichia sp. TaxID=2055881 RepID=UPI0028A142E2|nr:hypothetical protein [Pseudescherichia sp.]